MKVEELFGRDYTEFSEVDSFNAGNTVGGFISRRATEYYGALLITSINGEDVNPQLIMGTPKMHYPFSSREDGSRKYAFPIVKSVEAYEKLDGTNILCFSYQHNGGTYYSAKTRLRPFVGSGRFGNFLAMWQEVASMPTIIDIMNRHQCNLSFELYGARNPHLIVYPNVLDIALLFGVTNTGRIIPPSEIDCDLPKVRLWAEVDGDLIARYEAIRGELQQTLKQADEGYYSGSEGTVWYLKTPDAKCIQFKCKPETIEAIHFSAGCGISRNVVVATCWNAYENTDDPTAEFIKTLLAEEFKPEIIEANHYLIEKSLDFVKGELVFRQKVLMEYHQFNENILTDKPLVMRYMSQFFGKKDMRKVYTTIINFG